MNADNAAWTDIPTAAQLGTQLRIDSIRASTSAASGHPTSSMSAADIVAVLFARHLRYDWDNPFDPTNDHFIMSKGHASPLLYAAFRAVGVIDDDELMTGYRRLGCRLQGHPTPVLPWVDVATGSLGQGIANAVGVALAGKYLDRSNFHVWVLCGDSEIAEGSVWEAIDKAAYYRLGNLTIIVDVNRLGQRGETEVGWNLNHYADRFRAFGAKVVVVDGHAPAAIDAALEQSSTSSPTVVLARTVKGFGFSEVADQLGWHGTAFDSAMAERALTELGPHPGLLIRGPLPITTEEPADQLPGNPEAHLEPFTVGEHVATRDAYGAALAALGDRDTRVVALDAEVSNSTRTDAFAHRHPDRYFEMFIAEQQLVASAVGIGVRGYRPFASTFAAFLTRAHDFIRMAAVSQASIVLVGSHAGVEIGADGPSQMGLEDLAMMRTVYDATVLYPCDATSTAALVNQLASGSGIAYLRTTRGAYPVLYPRDESFPIGGAKVPRRSDHDDVTLIGAGVTVHQCLSAAEHLESHGIKARVVDAYSIKPLGAATIAAAVADTGGRVVVAEDHRPEGGLGDAVLAALTALEMIPVQWAHLAVQIMPGSGTPEELMHAAGIDAAAIVAAAKDLVASGRLGSGTAVRGPL